MSTHDQRETSIPSQIDRCKALLEQEGFAASHTLCADWTSLDLFSCPEFQELRSLIKDRDIEALAVFDRDRLEAKGLQRLVFLSECREAGVKLKICQGPPVLDEPEGQLVELALAIGKERQVLRARQGSRDGLHDRVLKRRLPTSRHKLYGYKWQEERILVPDENWPNVKLIFDMLLDGSTYWPIIGELKKRGILSPQGYPEWNKAAISNMVHNPSYTGRYYALKKQAVTPVKRNGITYGNSSQKKLPLDEAHYIPEIEIVNPPITWEQRLQILDQLAKHQKLAQRSAKRDYLLRGMIFCGTHTGKKGEPRAYHGQPHHESWRYTCPVGGCQHPYIDGPEIEKWVEGAVGTTLYLQPDQLYKLISGEEHRQKTEQSLKNELSQLDTKYNRHVQLEATLEDRYLRNEVGADVYSLLKARYRTEREGLKMRQDEVLEELAQIGREKEVIRSIHEIKSRIIRNVALDQLPDSEWRKLFEVMNIRVYVKAKGEAEIVRLRKKGTSTEVLGIPLELAYGIPISARAVSIASAKPEPG